MRIIIFLIVFFLAGPGTTSADIYKFVDKQGVAHYSNVQDDSNNNKILPKGKKYTLHSTRKQSPERPRKEYRQIINTTSEKYNIEPSLLKAVIEVESNWNSQAVSRKGAQGLMQLMPSTAKNLKVRNPFNPEENIEGGAKYLKSLLDKYSGDLSLALAAYNAGPGKIDKYGGVPPIAETKEYVKRVLGLYHGDKSTPIYKIKIRNGTVLYTNISSSNKGTKLSKF
jgi:soluble lytic murein transglycosylase